MLKIDTIGREWCLPCADTNEVEGVIVDRAGDCVNCSESSNSKKPETYLVTFEVTSETDPAEWDWNELLDLGVRESSYVHYIGQITRNNQREGEKCLK